MKIFKREDKVKETPIIKNKTTNRWKTGDKKSENPFRRSRYISNKVPKRKHEQNRGVLKHSEVRHWVWDFTLPAHIQRLKASGTETEQFIAHSNSSSQSNILHQFPGPQFPQVFQSIW